MSKTLTKGLIYSSIGRYGNFIITLLVNIVLSRILTPAEYGQVTALQIFITFFQLMSSAGIGIAIVQRRDITKSDIESIYSFSIIMSIVLAATFPLVGILVDLFYKDTVYFGISSAFSVAVLFYGLVVVPNAVLTKKLKFFAINIIQIVTIIFGAIIGIISAYSNLGAYSLVLMTIAITSLDFVLKSYLAHLRPGPLHLKSLKKIFDFAVNILVSDSLKYFSQNIDNILVGKVYGPTALGNYGKAYQLLRYPNYLISGVFVSVLGPVLASKKDDINYLKDFYYKLLLALSYVAFGISAFFIVNAQPIIEFLFGTQWSEAVTPFKILSLSVWVQILFSIIGPMFEIRDTTKHWRILTQINTIIMILFIVIGIMMGSLSKLSFAVTTGFIITYVISNYFLAKYVFNISSFVILKKLVKPLLLFISCFIVLEFSKNVTQSLFIHDFFYLLVNGIIMVGFSCCFVVLFGDVKNIISIFKESDE
ncbi:lipopolysaccharide biosynthesis protein [Leuconostoc mesenteroides]|uniref:lipopolysaccharide biosynthesis protein n=4 Tax=Leuconostoc mesenteroides TaxID=1245 RepID=UPI0007513A84|nr:lipopolysaccharide biosynthesis protein [Leuconostoc mesenteroides]MCM6831990.1 lipopolysaccharide biosynthesis protein [Leuconostoc mesenteroides]WMS39187.1 lipopolysaccharide biosynthesis protein [Leuconostoc mesenteroides]